MQELYTNIVFKLGAIYDRLTYRSRYIAAIERENQDLKRIVRLQDKVINAAKPKRDKMGRFQ